jgi:hypothetical protein
MSFKVNDRVDVLGQGSDLYLGRIDKINKDGSYKICFEDGDVGDVDFRDLRSLPIVNYNVDDRVEAYIVDDSIGANGWYPGTIIEAEKQGTYKILFDDSDELSVKKEAIKPEESTSKFRVNMNVKVNCDKLPTSSGLNGNGWCSGVVTLVDETDDGVFIYRVKFDDYDAEFWVRENIIKRIS